MLQEIWEHPLYAEAYRQLQEAEQGRKFCCHSAEHFLDVARIAYIQNLEERLGIRREVLYTAALLHDIGKALQYKERIPHEIASAEIAGTILNDLGDEFSKEEKAAILQAIRGHRSSWNVCFMRAIKNQDFVLYVRRKRNVTGNRRKRIWRSTDEDRNEKF